MSSRQTKAFIAGILVCALVNAPIGSAMAADAISLNFGSGNGTVDSEYGIFSTTGWVNLSDASGDRNDLASMAGQPLGRLQWNCKNIWSYTNGITDNALKGYLDDGGEDGIPIEIALTDIPFKFYRVIVYQATDTGGALFNPPSLNGVFYSSDGAKKSATRNNVNFRYGSSQNATAVVGTNVIKYPRVFSGDLTILGGGRVNSVRGCIAAVQIVEADSCYTATLTGDSNLDSLTWDPEKPADGFAAGSVLKVNYAGETPVTLTANGNYSGLGLAISGPIALKTTTGIKTACVSFDNGASLDLSAMAIDETAKAAVRGVPAATDFILGELDAASVTATLPTVTDGYSVALDAVNGFGTRLVVTAPNSADFGSVNFNISRTLDNAELIDGAKYGLLPVDKSSWTAIATNDEGKIVATTASGVTLTPTITNLAIDSADMGYYLFKGAVNDNPNDDESTATYGFTISNIHEGLGEKYRVIVSMISNQGAGFSPVTIGGKKYHGVGATAGVTMSSADEVRWGTLSANSTAIEGQNTVVSDVLTSDSVTIETCRNYNQHRARASICAVQVVKVGELAVAESVAFTANLTGDATWSSKTGFAGMNCDWVNSPDSTITLTNNSSAAAITLTVDENISAKSLKIVSPAGHRVKIVYANNATMDADILDYSEAPGYVVHMQPVSMLISDTVANRAWGGGNADPEQAIAIEHNGGELNLVGGTWKLQQSNNGTATTVRMVDALVAYTDVLGIGMASYYLGGTTAVTTPSLVISQGADGRTASLELADTSSVMVTGNTSADLNTSSVMFGHWNGPSTFTIKDSAAFTAPGDVLVGRTRNNHTINIQGGTFTARGIKLSENATGQNILNFNGGVLALGETGINTYSSGVTMQINIGNSPELRATAATLPIVEPVDIAAGATLNLTKAGGVEAATVTMSAAVTSEGNIHVGAGVTLKLMGLARPQGVITLAEGAKLHVQQLNSVEDTIELKLAGEPAEGALTVFDSNGNPVVPVTSFDDGTLTIKAVNVLSATSETATSFADASKWSFNTVPTSGNIIIALDGECTVSLSGDVAVDLLTVRGQGSLTFVGEGTLTTSRITIMEGSRVNCALGGNLVVSSTCSLAATSTLALSTATNASVSFAISGAGKVETAGDITFAAANTFTGGLTVKSGTVGTANYNGLGGSGETAYNGMITVEAGAALDLANTANYCYAFTIAGQGVLREDGTYSGALFNSGETISTGSRQMWKLVLSADAAIRVDIDHEYGILAGGYGVTTLTLNGHTLTKIGDGEFCMTQTNTSANDTGTIVVKTGALRFLNDKNNNLAGAKIVVSPGAALRVSEAAITACAGIVFEGGNSPIEFQTATGKLAEGIVPVVNATAFDPAGVAVGTEVTLLTDPNNGLLGTNDTAIVSLALGSRFTAVTVEAGAVKATVQDPLAANKFMHYDFNESSTEVTLDGAKAVDSTYAISSWGDKNGNGPFTVSKGRNGRSAHIFYTSDNDRFVPYWGGNSANKAPNYAGALTVTTVARLDFAGRTAADGVTTAVPLWGLGKTVGGSGFGLVCTSADSVGVVAWPTPSTAELIVEMTGIANLKTAFHFFAIVATPAGTTLYVDDRAVATAKTIPANIGQAGQIGSLHGGEIRAYSRVNTGDGGYYLDDWAIYDTALTAREIGRLRLRLLAVPLVFRVR